MTRYTNKDLNREARMIAMEIKRESLLSWDRLSVGYCHKCSKAHSLVDNLCWNCREEGK